jgi:hypothetical protein
MISRQATKMFFTGSDGIPLNKGVGSNLALNMANKKEWQGHNNKYIGYISPK